MSDDSVPPAATPKSSALDPAHAAAMRRIPCCLARPRQPSPSLASQLRRAAVLAAWLQEAAQQKAQSLADDQESCAEAR